MPEVRARKTLSGAEANFKPFRLQNWTSWDLISVTVLMDRALMEFSLHHW
jgi:hypothetical protein